jgi:hypothetical protein
MRHSRSGDGAPWQTGQSVTTSTTSQEPEDVIPAFFFLNCQEYFHLHFLIEVFAILEYQFTLTGN